ncbi:MAG: hypothetical protein ACYDG6_06640 [Thermincolia bacterium]
MAGACETSCAEVKVAQSEIENLHGWQKSQNGAIHRVEEKVDKLQFWMMTTFIMLVIQILGMLIKKG